MSIVKAAAAALALVSLVALPVTPAEAQFGKRLKDRLKRTVEREVERKAEDEVRQAVRCALGDTACIEKAKADGQPVEIVDDRGEVIRDDEGTPIDDPDRARHAAGGPEPGTGIWRNYDFVPGRDVWFASDFADERIGRFPASQLEFVSGNMQIVEKDGRNVLEVSSESVFRVALPDELPEGFSVEFTIEIPTPNMSTEVYFSPREVAHARYESAYITLYHTPGLAFKGSLVSSRQKKDTIKTMTPVRFQADGEYAILYVGEERVANVPNATLIRSDTIEFRVSANTNYRAYVADIVVAVGLDRLYESLMERGSFTTRGILFALDSDRLRPESTPVLEEIRRTLERHEELSIAIEGHTDSQGADDYNLELSERRANAVVEWLVAQGIDAGRLRAVGKGEGEPAADNATPQGRAQNRRVVIRRLE